MDWSKAANRENRQVSFQGRLDKVLESQKRALHDNTIKNVGTPEDVLVIQKKTTANGDTISKVISDHKVINCVFPILKDVPIRRVTQEFESGYTLTSLVSAYGEGGKSGQGSEQKDVTTVDLIVPFDAGINVGDRLVRVLVQTDIQASTVMVFDVIDITADFSNNAPLTAKAKIALTTEPIDLDKPSYQMIVKMSHRRLAAGY